VNPYNVIKSPILSEKSTNLRESFKQYAFKVSLDASKDDVKAALRTLYDVDVTKVTTSITRGKVRRRGMKISLSSKTKKAMVTLREGQKLPIFED
jgi:large subunit ribosomal protein L23